MAALGSPMGFAKKLGGGVTDLFYEPYQGAVLSPQDFVLGIGKGTTSFASNVVSGVMDSVGAISGTASKGFGYLSGDGEYVRQRALQKQKQKQQQGRGILDGILDGAESVASGLTSGLSGLVTKPIEGAQKSGAGGFFKGIGLGLLGAVVKPVMGVTDGLSSISSGVSNQVTTETIYTQVRPVRAMFRSSTDQDLLTIGKLNVKAAYAQEFVIKRSKSQQYEDTFLSYTVLEAQTDECIILSETYLYWRKERSLWGRTWSNVSHVLFFGTAVGIVLYSPQEGYGEVVNVGCYTREKAVELYEELARNSSRMGNPCNVIPLVAVVKPQWLQDPEYVNT
jgi:vacuolar protein sorting-associated protein 13A/C